MPELREWTKIVDLTAGELWQYIGFRWGHILIPDYSRDELTALTLLWHKSVQYKYITLAGTLGLEYDPINNYDRTTRGERTRTPDLETHTAAQSSSDTETGGTDSSTATDTTTAKVAPYDSENFSNRDSSSGSGSSSTTYGRTESTTGGGSQTVTETGTDTEEYSETVRGNIGVTTTQQMIQQERDISDFVLLDMYLSDWIKNFSIGIYSGNADF